MSTTARITRALLLAGLAAWIGWDIYVAFNSVTGDTISELTLGWSYTYSVIPYAAGVVAGHLWWPGPRPTNRTLPFLGLAAVSALVAGFDYDTATLFPLYPLVTGIVVGHLLWPQAGK